MTEQGKILSMAEAAERLGVSKDTCRRWAKEGQMPGAFRINKKGRWRIREADLDKLIKQSQHAVASGQDAETASQ